MMEFHDSMGRGRCDSANQEDFFFALGVKPPRYLPKFTPLTLDLFLGWVSHTNKRLLTLIETSVTFAL